MNSFILNNSVEHKYIVYLLKIFLFQAIQFIQTVLIKTIQFSISIVFVYTQLNVKTIIFQVIQFCISTFFSSLSSIDRTLSVATSPGQSEPGNDVNEGVLIISQSCCITGTLPSECLVSYQDTRCGVFYPSTEMQSLYSTTPARGVMVIVVGNGHGYRSSNPGQDW